MSRNWNDWANWVHLMSVSSSQVVAIHCRNSESMEARTILAVAVKDQQGITTIATTQLGTGKIFVYHIINNKLGGMVSLRGYLAVTSTLSMLRVLNHGEGVSSSAETWDIYGLNVQEDLELAYMLHLAGSLAIAT